MSKRKIGVRTKERGMRSEKLVEGNENSEVS